MSKKEIISDKTAKGKFDANQDSFLTHIKADDVTRGLFDKKVNDSIPEIVNKITYKKYGNNDSANDFTDTIFKFIQTKTGQLISSPNNIDKAVNDKRINFDKSEEIILNILKEAKYNFENNNSNKKSYKDLIKDTIISYQSGIDADKTNGIANFYKKYIVNKKTYDQMDDVLLDNSKKLKKHLDYFNNPPKDGNVTYSRDPFTGKNDTGFNSLINKLYNCDNNENFINFAPMAAALSKWKRKKNTSDFKCSMRISRDENGNRTFTFTMPTKTLDQDVIKEDPKTQPSLLNVGMNIQDLKQLRSEMKQNNEYDLKDPKTCEKLLTALLADRINTSYTKIGQEIRPINKLTAEELKAIENYCENHPKRLEHIANKAEHEALKNILKPEIIKECEEYRKKCETDIDFKTDYLKKFYQIYETIENKKPTPPLVALIQNEVKNQNLTGDFSKKATKQGAFIDVAEKLLQTGPALYAEVDKMANTITKEQTDKQKKVKKI